MNAVASRRPLTTRNSRLIRHVLSPAAGRTPPSLTPVSPETRCVSVRRHQVQSRIGDAGERTLGTRFETPGEPACSAVLGSVSPEIRCVSARDRRDRSNWDRLALRHASAFGLRGTYRFGCRHSRFTGNPVCVSRTTERCPSFGDGPATLERVSRVPAGTILTWLLGVVPSGHSAQVQPCPDGTIRLPTSNSSSIG
jgi:hypothetical protein